ncbi:GxxExxY protein [Candidatus Gottesmanbacteria bacterium]|nr:GxxExxY protein [Candidatus Gottesmanbacteria bacterium]
MKQALRRPDLLYPEISYRIIGCAFDVYNNLGSGYHEKYYQKALMAAFTLGGLTFQSEISFPLTYRGKIIGRKRLDFLVEGRVVVELKKGDNFSKSHIDQVVEYLRTQNLKLAILINFGSRGVMYKRIVNL